MAALEAAEGRRWVREMRPGQVLLATLPACVERHRVKVDPTPAACPQLQAHRQPVCLGHVTEVGESRDAGAHVVSVDRQVEVAMLPGLAPDEDRNPPATGDPVTYVCTVQGGEHGCDVGDPHASERADRVFSS
jgi:hypothetical protein